MVTAAMTADTEVPSQLAECHVAETFLSLLMISSFLRKHISAEGTLEPNIWLAGYSLQRLATRGSMAASSLCCHGSLVLDNGVR